MPFDLLDFITTYELTPEEAAEAERYGAEAAALDAAERELWARFGFV